MKLEIKRVTTEKKAFLGGPEFKYSINVKLLVNDKEKKMWEKYEYLSKEFLVVGSGDSSDIESFAKNVKGWRYVSFNKLLQGQTWETNQLYVSFTAIPTVIAEQLQGMQAQLNLREHWNGQNEILDLSEK